MSDWQETTLGRIARIIPGYAFKSEDFGCHGYPIVKITHIVPPNVQINDNEKVNISNYKNIDKYQLQKGDFVVAMTGATIGKVGRIRTNSIAYLNQRVAKIEAKKDLSDNDFLYFLVSNMKFTKYIESFSSGSSAQANISGSDIERFPICIPELVEQRRIAAILSALDNKIDLLRRQNATLEHLAQTLFTRWFVEFEFPNEVGQPYKSSGGAMVASEFGEIPVGWRFSKIGDKVKFLGGGTPSTKEPAYWEAGKIVWYSPTDLTKNNRLYSLDSGKHITELGLQKSSAKLFPAYSLLLTSRATVGEIAINTQKACTNQGFITLIPNEKFSVYFLHGWLKTQLRQIRNLASGSTFPEISKAVFGKLDIVIADQKTMDCYFNVTKPTYQKIENNINQIQTLTRLRDALLPKLMSGQIRVTA